MTLRHSVGSPFDADALFPSEEDGKNVTPTPKAVALARRLLSVPADSPDSDIVWVLPDVFSVPYGSPEIGTASFAGLVVEFFYED
jgi:hypothetical protein